MQKRLVVLAMVLVVLSAASPASHAQRGQAAPQAGGPPPAELKLLDGWGQPVTNPLKPGEQPGPAPKRDLSGTWLPADGAGAGIQPMGPKEMPYDGKPEHDPPYSALGLKTLKEHKPLYGFASVLPSLNNDPRGKCDPMGFPRADFYQLRHTQIMQDAHKIAILYQFDKRWRIIWTDGRELPKEVPVPRYYGYSVGKWVDDYTLVVQTVGLIGDEKVWLDEAGRPASEQMRVEEVFHRVNNDRIELTVTVDDPKMYTKPWVGMKNFPLKLDGPDYDVMEMLCIPSEIEQYSKDYGDQASGLDSK